MLVFQSRLVVSLTNIDSGGRGEKNWAFSWVSQYILAGIVWVKNFFLFHFFFYFHTKCSSVCQIMSRNDIFVSNNTFIRQTLLNFPVDIINKTIETMAKRLREVIATNGYRTKYWTFLYIDYYCLSILSWSLNLKCCSTPNNLARSVILSWHYFFWPKKVILGLIICSLKTFFTNQ